MPSSLFQVARSIQHDNKDMQTNDEYLWAWKNSGMSDLMIAARLNIKQEDVERRYQELKAAMKTAEENKNGEQHLVGAFSTMCLQYQLLGESLKQISANLNPAKPDEIRDVMGDMEEDPVANLMREFIILRPFKESEVAQIAAALGKS